MARLIFEHDDGRREVKIEDCSIQAATEFVGAADALDDVTEVLEFSDGTTWRRYGGSWKNPDNDGG
jgi:hypothetical protein